MYFFRFFFQVPGHTASLNTTDLILRATGHICYSLDEFDFVMVSLVNDKVNRDKIKDCNLWSYSLINIKDLEDKDHGCCVSHIAPTILKKNIIKVNEDIRDKLA